jgi:hypothetical protein
VQGVQEAGPDALVGAPGVGGAVGMALEPDRQQIGVGTRIGVQRRQPIATLGPHPEPSSTATGASEAVKINI